MFFSDILNDALSFLLRVMHIILSQNAGQERLGSLEVDNNWRLRGGQNKRSVSVLLKQI